MSPATWPFRATSQPCLSFRMKTTTGVPYWAKAVVRDPSPLYSSLFMSTAAWNLSFCHPLSLVRKADSQPVNRGTLKTLCAGGGEVQRSPNFWSSASWLACRHRHHQSSGVTKTGLDMRILHPMQLREALKRLQQPQPQQFRWRIS